MSGSDALRSLSFEIDFGFDIGLLRDLNDEVDNFRNEAIDSLGFMGELGTISEETGEIMMTSFEDAAMSAENLGLTLEDVEGSSRSTGNSVRELGQETTRAGREGRSSLIGLGNIIDDIGDSASSVLGTIKAGIGGIMATGLTGWLYSNASALETNMVRSLFWVKEGSEEFDLLSNSIKNVIDLSNGLHSEGELFGAANKAFNSGIDVDFIAEHMDSAAIVAAATDSDISSVLVGIGKAVENGTIKPLRDLGIITDETFEKLGFAVSRSIQDWDSYRRELLVTTGLQDFYNDKIDNYGNYLKTSGAQMGIFRSELGNIAEIMGGPILSPINQVIRGISSLFKIMQGSPFGEKTLEILGLGIALGSTVVGVSGLLKAGALLKPLFIPTLGTVLKIGTILLGAYLIIEDLVFAFGGFGDSLTETIFDSTMELLGFDITFESFRDSIISGLKFMGGFFIGIWSDIMYAWETGEGWLGGLLHGLGSMFEGYLISWANLFKMGFGLVWGIFTGDWTILEEGFEGLLQGIGLIWDGFKMVVAGPLDWGLGKITEWKDSALDKVDELVQGFLNIPGTVMEGLKGFGNDLYESITKPLEKIRRLLPFSPAKEGPLMDLHESGANIIGNIQEGIAGARPLTLLGQVEPISSQMKNLQGSISVEAGDNSQFEQRLLTDLHENGANMIGKIQEGMSMAKPLEIGTSLEGISNSIRNAVKINDTSIAGRTSAGLSPQFHSHVTVEYSGTASRENMETLARTIDRRMEFSFKQLMEDYCKIQRRFRPNLTER